jgi:hypothetical protein
MADGSYAIAARNRFSARYGIHFSRIYGRRAFSAGPGMRLRCRSVTDCYGESLRPSGTLGMARCCVCPWQTNSQLDRFTHIRGDLLIIMSACGMMRTSRSITTCYQIMLAASTWPPRRCERLVGWLAFPHLPGRSQVNQPKPGKRVTVVTAVVMLRPVIGWTRGPRDDH